LFLQDLLERQHYRDLGTAKERPNVCLERGEAYRSEICAREGISLYMTYT